ncbi:MAG: CerR family C-terminal domain-containing protein [Planctomycetota bacterium]|nr:CerR family C-terminal domain-containing protein [Planctomycetota bacterium]
MKERNSGSTREAIICAAGELFASRGFDAVTAREVAKRAGVALSAIPYHFRSMENLYREVLLRASEVSPQASDLAEASRQAPPERCLQLAIRWALKDFACVEHAWILPLLAREDLRPSAAFDEVIRRKFAPEWAWLCEVVGRATGQAPDSTAVRFGASTMYLLLFSLAGRSASVGALAPDVVASLKNEDVIVEVLAGLTIDAVRRFEPHAPARKPAPGTTSRTRRSTSTPSATESRGKGHA